MGFLKDEDYGARQTDPKLKAQVVAYCAGGSVGPDPDEFDLDCETPKSSPWNLQISKIILGQMKQDEAIKEPLPCDEYMLDIIKERMLALARARKDHKVLRTRAGEQETAQKQEQRIVETKDQKAKRGRQAGRRQRVSVVMLVRLIA